MVEDAMTRVNRGTKQTSPARGDRHVAVVHVDEETRHTQRRSIRSRVRERIAR